jgi:hypothetical protein
VIYSILTCRIIFNIRSASEAENPPIDLYTTLTLEFRVDGGHLEDTLPSTSTRHDLRDHYELDAVPPSESSS